MTNVATLPCPHEDTTGFGATNCSTTIPYTGGVQTYTVPPGVSSLGISAIGGGSIGAGSGNVAEGSLPAVTPGEVLTIQDGSAGAQGSLTGTGGAGGYGGGGAGGSSATDPDQAVFPQDPGGDGGGGADVRVGWRLAAARCRRRRRRG